MTNRARWFRVFDRDYWLMRVALGYPLPWSVERWWKKSMNRPNPFMCGKCEAMRRFPGVNIAQAILHVHDTQSPEWTDVRRRVLLALQETAP